MTILSACALDCALLNDAATPTLFLFARARAERDRARRGHGRPARPVVSTSGAGGRRTRNVGSHATFDFEEETA